MTPLPPAVAEIRLSVVVGDLRFDLTEEPEGYAIADVEAFPELGGTYGTAPLAAAAIEGYYNSLGPTQAPSRRRGARARTTGANA